MEQNDVRSIESTRLILRRFNYDDWIDLYDYLSKPEVVQFEPYTTQTQEQCKAEVKRRANDKRFFAVCLKSNNKVIGNLYFNHIEPMQHNTWEIGFVFNSAYSKKGYATEACETLFQWGFDRMKIHRIIGYCNTDNVSSWNLMERLGMRREGHQLKKGFFEKNNTEQEIQWFNVFQYAILEEEWFLRKNKL